MNKKTITVLIGAIIALIALTVGIIVIVASTSPHSHEYGGWQSSDTQHWKECSCGDKSDLANHNWNAGEVTTPATKESEGVKTIACTDCGKTKTEKIAKLPEDHNHSFITWKYDDDKHWKECSCGAKENEATHDFGVGVITIQPQYGVAGERTFTCECGKTKTEPVDALTKPAAEISGMNAVTLDKEYDGTAVTSPANLTTTNTDAGAAIIFEWYQGSTKLATAPKDAGTYTMLAIVNETANFARVEEGKQFTISAKEITVNWTAPNNLEYSKTEKMASASAVGLMGGDTATIQVTGVNNVNPGTATFTAVSQNPNYVVKTTDNADKKLYTITPKTLTNVVIAKEYDGDSGNSGYISVSEQLNETHGVFDGDVVFVSMTSMTGIVPMIDAISNDFVINTPTTASVVGTHASYYNISPSEVKLQRIPKKITISSSNLNFNYTGSTTFTYTLTEFDELVDSALGEEYNGGTVEFTVANANVSAGAQTPTQIGFTDCGYTELVRVNGYYLYQIVNMPTVTITPATYEGNFQYCTVKYNGTTTFDFSVWCYDDQYIHLTCDVLDGSVSETAKDVFNVRLTENTTLPENYSGITINDSMIKLYVTPVRLTIDYTTEYTGSEITVPTLTKENATFTGLIKGEDVSITGVVLKEMDASTLLYVGESVELGANNLESYGTLTGADAGNYKIDFSSVFVRVAPKPIADAVDAFIPGNNLKYQSTPTNCVYDIAPNVQAEFEGYYHYANGQVGEKCTDNLEVGSYLVEIELTYKDGNHIIAPTAPITINGRAVEIIRTKPKSVVVGYVIEVVENRYVANVTTNVSYGTNVSAITPSIDNDNYTVTFDKIQVDNGSKFVDVLGGKIKSGTYRVFVTVTAKPGYELLPSQTARVDMRPLDETARTENSVSGYVVFSFEAQLIFTIDLSAGTTAGQALDSVSCNEDYLYLHSGVVQIFDSEKNKLAESDVLGLGKTYTARLFFQAEDGSRQDGYNMAINGRPYENISNSVTFHQVLNASQLFFDYEFTVFYSRINVDINLDAGTTRQQAVDSISLSAGYALDQITFFDDTMQTMGASDELQTGKTYTIWFKLRSPNGEAISTDGLAATINGLCYAYEPDVAFSSYSTGIAMFHTFTVPDPALQITVDLSAGKTVLQVKSSVTYNDDYDMLSVGVNEKGAITTLADTDVLAFGKTYELHLLFNAKSDAPEGAIDLLINGVVYKKNSPALNFAQNDNFVQVTFTFTVE